MVVKLCWQKWYHRSEALEVSSGIKKIITIILSEFRIKGGQCLDWLCADYLNTRCDEKEVCGENDLTKINGVHIRNCDLLGITYDQWARNKHFISSDSHSAVDGKKKNEPNVPCVQLT